MNTARIQFMIMAMVAMPLFSMEHENVVRIKGDVFVIAIKESNLVLMKALHTYTQFHKGKIKQCGIVPRYQHVCSDEICLVDTALTVRPDKFADYYNKLSKQDRLLLIKASGQYNEDGKKVMLDVPEVTKRLIEVCFTDNGLRNHIKSYLKHEDEDYVRNYFKEQLIYSKRLLMLKNTDFFEETRKYRLTNDIYLGSVFLNGFHTIHPYDYPISLRMGDKVRQTYATCFAIDNYEYRITDVRDNQCLLWVVNHNNPDATFSTIIKHKGNIKGCTFSSTKTDVEGVLTYSDHDMVFSTITMLNGVLFVDSVLVESPHQIVDVCFEPVKSRWLVGTYEGLDSVIRNWDMEGKCTEECTKNLPFKEYGLLEKLAISKTSSGYRFAEIMGVANMYSTAMSHEAKDNGEYEFYESTSLRSLYSYYKYGTTEIMEVGKSITMFNLRYPFFKENTEDDLLSQSASEVHRVYSPQGTFLMRNSLKKKWGMLYVETVVQDAITHKQIISIDTLYAGFVGVGFTHDEAELIFLDTPKDSKVSLLTREDKQMLSQIEDVACTNLGVASLVKRLCMECKKNSTVALYDNDPVRAMLRDWAGKSPELLQLLKTCLPMTIIKK